MTRGTTPTIKIKPKNCDVSLLDSIYITFKQYEKTLEKSGDDIEVDKDQNMLIVRLTQEDTLYFYAVDVNVQIRATTKDGQAIASEVFKLPMHNILKNGVI